MHQRSGVERDVAVPPSPLLAGEDRQLTVHERKERCQCCGVSVLDRFQ
jgi:hypothetical protein